MQGENDDKCGWPLDPWKKRRTKVKRLLDTVWKRLKRKQDVTSIALCQRLVFFWVSSRQDPITPHLSSSMQGEFWLFYPGKVRSHSTALPSFFVVVVVLPCVQCFRVSIPRFVRPTLLRQMNMASLTCAQIWVRAVHTKGSQAQTCLRKSWLGGIGKQYLPLPRQGIEPRVFGFEFRRSNHWATSPVVKGTNSVYGEREKVVHAFTLRQVSMM